MRAVVAEENYPCLLRKLLVIIVGTPLFCPGGQIATWGAVMVQSGWGSSFVQFLGALFAGYLT